jgi:flavin reductase (DIM6/NTAB) family NADH-FMN oxidoreductase RutF
MLLPKCDWQDVDLTEAKSLRQAFGGFATGVAIVTCLDQNQQPVGLTINSFSSVSLEPAMVLWSLVNHSPSRQIFEKAEYFAINILGADQQEIGLNFAKSIPDKFEHGSWNIDASKAPVLEDCVVQFICRRDQQIEVGDHQIFLGQIEQCRQSNQRPLLFCKGQFNQWPEYQEVS